jgi:hypothetical protein
MNVCFTAQNSSCILTSKPRQTYPPQTMNSPQLRQSYPRRRRRCTRCSGTSSTSSIITLFNDTRNLTSNINIRWSIFPTRQTLLLTPSAKVLTSSVISPYASHAQSDCCVMSMSAWHAVYATVKLVQGPSHTLCAATREVEARSVATMNRRDNYRQRKQIRGMLPFRHWIVDCGETNMGRCPLYIRRYLRS